MRCPNEKCHISGTVGNYCCMCGTKLEDSLRCEQCKEIIYENENYCRECGHEIIRTSKTSG